MCYTISTYFFEKGESDLANKSVYTPIEISNQISGSDSLKLLYSEAGKMLGKILSSSDMQTLMWIYDYLGLPVPVILMIVGYAVSNGKENMRYIEKVAMNWADEGISTIELAEEHLADLENKKSFENKIKNLFGIKNRGLTPGEKNIVSEWEESSLSDEVLLSAFEINIERTGKLSLRYINGIIKNWREQKKQTQTAKAPQKKHNNFTERPDIDFDAREIEILKRQMGENK